jgi:hypothetical protein
MLLLTCDGRLPKTVLILKRIGNWFFTRVWREMLRRLVYPLCEDISLLTLQDVPPLGFSKRGSGLCASIGRFSQAPHTIHSCMVSLNWRGKGQIVNSRQTPKRASPCRSPRHSFSGAREGIAARYLSPDVYPGVCPSCSAGKGFVAPLLNG